MTPKGAIETSLLEPVWFQSSQAADGGRTRDLKLGRLEVALPQPSERRIDIRGKQKQI
jgi:hypothetical protein